MDLFAFVKKNEVSNFDFLSDWREINPTNQAFCDGFLES